MTPEDFSYIIHPAIAVIFVFPLIGAVTHFALQTRQRRLEAAAGEKSKVPATVGREHLRLGKWLAAAVVSVSLLGLLQPILLKGIIEGNLFAEAPFEATFLLLMFPATAASLALLYLARQPLWRGVFATLTGMGLVVLGCNEAIFRRTYEWYVSHYYFGIVVALLMVLSLATVEDIYRDRSLAWRRAHAFLNSVAFLLFLAQGMTGARDLFEIALYKTP
ncbi:hypothetical protein KR51_00015620 [Rubidibacter lacunae KORDI 51-2]|uniref:DUF4079 domain-containing protein n=1 Tax=Rubidibacter lacunae KORDI 51-2 TaxID=582515 RepID=U5DLG4_9CHRO|nr:DUF4079 domain-containing protein [Rubidibacter lacunae]ERN41717.1 hypothetical protein KR51_00015620 [Rubidibacter lacunae KORDI 51-2]